MSVRFVLEAGLEPAQPQWPQDFKSCVSTDSTTRASGAKNGTRTRDPNLGKVMLYQLSYFRIRLPPPLCNKPLDKSTLAASVYKGK